MLAVAAGAGLALGDGQHRLHPDDHAGFQHRVDILAQFQPGLAAGKGQYPVALTKAA